MAPLSTRSYTLFFSFDEASRINSESLVDGAFFLKIENIGRLVGRVKHLFKVSPIVFFRDIIVNSVDIGLINPIRTVVIFQ